MQTSYGLTPYSIALYVIIIVLSTSILLHNESSDVQGQLDIPNITQREEPESPLEDSLESPHPVEQMAMQALFTQSGQLYGFGLNVNNGSLLCPSDNCEFTFEEGILREEADGEYVLEGKLLAAEKGAGNTIITPFTVKADLNVNETIEKDSGITKFMIGFFDARSDTSNELGHYFIHNGTLNDYPEGLIMILQGKVLPKMT